MLPSRLANRIRNPMVPYCSNRNGEGAERADSVAQGLTRDRACDAGFDWAGRAVERRSELQESERRAARDGQGAG